MFTECRYILPTGYKCKAAALRGQVYCYFHTTARRYRSGRSSDKLKPLEFPSIEDIGGVQIALNQVLAALGSSRIDSRQAGLFFYGLQIAAGLATKPDEKLDKTVREACEDSAGDSLAPEKTTCEPPADCVACRRRDFCENFELYEDDVEELEERLEAEREAGEESEEESSEDEE